MEKHFKQLIIARRDLNMSPGKYLLLSSLRFLARESARFLSSKLQTGRRYLRQLDQRRSNRGKLEKAIEKVKELGMIEGVDYFPIVDA